MGNTLYLINTNYHSGKSNLQITIAIQSISSTILQMHFLNMDSKYSIEKSVAATTGS